MGKRKIFIWTIAIASAMLYGFFAYGISRTDTTVLLGVWTALFALYAAVLAQQWTVEEITQLLGCSIFFRCLFLCAVPNLSDDFYRFIWDGRLSVAGINPYRHLPMQLVTSLPDGLEMKGLYEHLNSPHYYSVYPPLLQWIFKLATSLFPHGILAPVIVMRLIIIAAEVLLIRVLQLLVKRLSMPPAYVLLYALNPLVIIELTGNLHFEAVMLLFVLLSFLFLLRRWLVLSAISLALAVCTKLLPLIFLPLLLFQLKWKQAIFYSLAFMVTVGCLFLPWVNIDLMRHMLDSVQLYFKHFEFNASVFYIARGVGFLTVGYDPIAFTGKLMFLLAGLSIIIYTSRKRDIGLTNLPHTLQTVMAIYLLFALVVHPWYVSGLLVFSVFTRRLYAIVFSFLVGFSYMTYTQLPYQENVYIIVVEYAITIIFFIYESYQNKMQLPAVATEP